MLGAGSRVSGERAGSGLIGKVEAVVVPSRLQHSAGSLHFLEKVRVWGLLVAQRVQNVIEFAELDFHQLGGTRVGLIAAAYCLPPGCQALDPSAHDERAAEEAIKRIEERQPDLQVIIGVRVQTANHADVIEHEERAEFFEVGNASAD